jgi:hypothetical protein
VKKRGRNADQWLSEAKLALDLAPWLSPDLTAVLHPALALDLALDGTAKLARTLELESQFYRTANHSISKSPERIKK